MRMSYPVPGSSPVLSVLVESYPPALAPDKLQLSSSRSASEDAENVATRTA